MMEAINEATQNLADKVVVIAVVLAACAALAFSAGYLKGAAVSKADEKLAAMVIENEKLVAIIKAKGLYCKQLLADPTVNRIINKQWKDRKNAL